ncbi:MAG: insulinase family protein [Syntrophobacterales bacterium]|nr:MAG: insulinase family protein [Syntrophobacterales bacterium]
MYQKTVLKNGIRVVSEKIPHIRSFSIGIWVTTGSCDEDSEENGISHFIEHLAFKGTKSRSAHDIAKEIDSVGGILNGFTEREYTCFHAKVLDQHCPLAIELLSDIFLNSLFDFNEIEKERNVVLQEIKMVEDTPDDYIHDLFNQVFWEGYSLGYPILGRKERVSSFDRKTICRYFDNHYRRNPLVISMAGSFDHEKVIQLIEDRFAGLPERMEVRKRKSPEPNPRIGVFPRDLEQVHLCLGTNGISQTHSMRFASYILNTLLGRGMSSYLFQEIREKRGLAYSIYSYRPAYFDAGQLVVYAGTSKGSLKEVIQLIIEQFNELRKERIRLEELKRAQDQLKGNFLLFLESSDSWMTRLAQNEIYFGEYIPIEEVIRGIEGVTSEEVNQLARDLFREELFCLAVLGPIDETELPRNLLSFR